MARERRARRGLRGAARAPSRRVVPCAWVESTHPSYTLYTSGTTGRPKGVQRDTGGYAVALAASMKHIFCGHAGETYFSTSDIGWVVGHSYIVYGPLIAGMATILYEGLPIRPDAGIWWRLVEKYQVTVMFTAPTAIRVLKKQDPAHLRAHDLSCLRALFLAGEPLDEPTATWISEAIGKPVIDNYWQTESGWPILTRRQRRRADAEQVRQPRRARCTATTCASSTRRPVDDIVEPGSKGVVAIAGPDAARLHADGVARRRAASSRPTGRASPAAGSTTPSTGASATPTATGSSSAAPTTSSTSPAIGSARARSRRASRAMPSVAEVAVVGVADALKGQVAMAFVVARDACALGDAAAAAEARGRHHEDRRPPARRAGAAGARPLRRAPCRRRAPASCCGARSRRSASGATPGDLTTIEDPTRAAADPRARAVARLKSRRRAGAASRRRHAVDQSTSLAKSARRERSPRASVTWPEWAQPLKRSTA